MTKPTCYIMSGIPGCGKSTWSRKFTAEHDNVVQVSRDEIRFSLLADMPYILLIPASTMNTMITIRLLLELHFLPNLHQTNLIFFMLLSSLVIR